MGRDRSTTKIAAADLRGLLDTMTPPERQCATTQMSPLAIESLHAAPEPPLQPPARMSIASSNIVPLDVSADDDAGTGDRGDLLIVVGVFVASSAVGGILMLL